MIFPEFSRLSWTKVSEISIKTVENIDEVEWINLSTTCATKLHRYYRVTLHILNFHKKKFQKFQPLPSTDPPFITFVRVTWEKEGSNSTTNWTSK